MTTATSEFVTDADRWSHAGGARYVDPQEWLASAMNHLDRSLHLEVLAEGLAAAADDKGRLIGFQPNKFYAGPLSDVMRNEDDDQGWTLTYDRFTAMALQDATYRFLMAGLLAHRGNGDSYDYRLTLPAVTA